MEIKLQKEGNSARIDVSGRIDEHGAEELKRRFQEMNIGLCDAVVFDFKQVSHIGSAGIGKLLLFYRQLETNGGTMKVENASKTVSDLLKLVELDSLFGVS